MKESTFKITLATVKLQLGDLRVDCNHNRREKKDWSCFYCRFRKNKSHLKKKKIKIKMSYMSIHTTGIFHLKTWHFVVKWSSYKHDKTLQVLCCAAHCSLKEALWRSHQPEDLKGCSVIALRFSEAGLFNYEWHKLKLGCGPISNQNTLPPDTWLKDCLASTFKLDTYCCQIFQIWAIPFSSLSEESKPVKKLQFLRLYEKITAAPDCILEINKSKTEIKLLMQAEEFGLKWDPLRTHTMPYIC